MIFSPPLSLRIDPLSWLPASAPGVRVDVLRLDEIHPVISGNKWFKLRYYLEESLRENKKAIITYGGAWSNHIVATAACCGQYQIPSHGIIRGEEPLSYSQALNDAKAAGMTLHFISRDAYRRKEQPPFLQQLLSEGKGILVPEGGFGETGVKGAATLVGLVDTNPYSHLLCAAGTGTMMAGLISAVSENTSVLGVSVLKNTGEIEKNVKSLLHHDQISPHSVNYNYSFGGYAHYSDELIRFMNQFYSTTRIPADFVYTGKLFYALYDLIGKNYFPPGSNILVIHSGGLQGNRSLENDRLIY